MFESYKEARARHTILRHEAYAAAREEAISIQRVHPSLHLADIDGRALDRWRSTWIGAHRSGAGRWNWLALVEQLPRRAAVLPLAIWFGEDLCGLALGHASRHRTFGGRHTMTLTHVERRPEPPEVPLRGRVILIAITAAENYGLTLGATRLRLSHPDRNLLPFYLRLGFSVARKGDKPVYCEREI